MSGSRYLLDTNAIIQLLAGNGEIGRMLDVADFVAMSVISEFEFLAYSELDKNEKDEYTAFRSYLRVFDVPSANPLFTQYVIEARKTFKLKLPDAIIAATARVNDLTILTADDHFKPLVVPWKVQFYIPT